MVLKLLKTKCLQLLSSPLKRFIQPKRSSHSVPAQLDSIENGQVARFIFHKRELNEDGTVKPKLFEPENEKGARPYETSVCNKEGTSEDRIWELGKSIRAGKQSIARADVGVSVVLSCELEVVPAPEIFPEHAVIIGWPPSEDDKARRKDLANAISAEALTIMSPTRIQS